MVERVVKRHQVLATAVDSDLAATSDLLKDPVAKLSRQTEERRLLLVVLCTARASSRYLKGGLSELTWFLDSLCCLDAWGRSEWA